MKNKLVIFVSALMIAASLTACGSTAVTNTDNPVSTSVPSTSALAAAVDDAEPVSSNTSSENSDSTKKPENAGNPNVAGGPLSGAGGPVMGQPIKEIPMDDAYLGKILDLTDKPTCSVKNDATDADFTGKWECEVAVNGDTAYSSILGYPLYATDRMEINADKTGKIISTAGGKDGVTTTEREFTWSVNEGVLTADIKSEAGGTYQVVIHMSDDGRIILISKARDGADVSAYYRSVEDFTAFDFSSVHFDYAALSE